MYATAFDVTDPEAVDAGLRETEATAGPVDILVNNAGAMHRQPMLDMPLADWQRLLDTDLTSAFIVGPGRRAGHGRARLRQDHQRLLGDELGDQARHRGVRGGQGRPGHADPSMCAEWAARGVTANGLAPGYVVTDLTQPLADDPEFDAWLRRRTPACRWGRWTNWSARWCWLAAPASDYVNGQVIAVDGGMTAVL